MPASGSEQQDVVLLMLIRAARAGYAVVKDDVPQMQRAEVLARIDELVERSPHHPIATQVTRSIDTMVTLLVVVVTTT